MLSSNELVNPIKDLKEQTNLSFAEAAKEWGVNVSVIQRTLEGCYPEIPPTLLEAISYRHGYKALTIAHQYYDWQLQELSRVNLPPTEPSLELNPEEFSVWCKLLLIFNNQEFPHGSMSHPVGRLLKLNPTIIDRFFKGQAAKLPVGIVERYELIRKLQASDY